MDMEGTPRLKGHILSCRLWPQILTLVQGSKDVNPERKVRCVEVGFSKAENPAPPPFALARKREPTRRPLPWRSPCLAMERAELLPPRQKVACQFLCHPPARLPGKDVGLPGVHQQPCDLRLLFLFRVIRPAPLNSAGTEKEPLTFLTYRRFGTLAGF